MSMTLEELRDEMDDLSSAEDFLNWFDIPFEQSVVHVNRLHILQRFHDYLEKNPLPPGKDAYAHHKAFLLRAYVDFVKSSAQEQKVLKVFKQPEPGFVSMDDFE